MITFEDLIDEMNEVKELFSTENLMRINSSIKLLKSGYLIEAQNPLSEILDSHSSRGLYSDFIKNWIFAMRCINHEGYLIDEDGNYTSFKDLINRGLVKVDKEKNSIRKVAPRLLGTLYLPTYIDKIEQNSFSETYLSEIHFGSNFSYLAPEAFCSSSHLERITLPREVAVIPASCFEGCMFLEEIKLNEKLHTIKTTAFRNCLSLKEIEFNEKLDSIETYGFAGCSHLEKVTFKGSFIGKGAFKDCRNLEEFNFIDSNFVKVESEAFKECKKCTINVYNDLCQYKEDAFTDCKELRNC